MGKLYIAYGSNLNRRAMRRRCPSAKFLGGFLLEDAQLVFRGVADVEFKEGAKVPCGLWMINRQDEKALDVYEGVSGGMYFKNHDIKISYAGGPKQSALIYLMTTDGIFPPSEFYVDTIREGYRDFNLDKYKVPVDYVDPETGVRVQKEVSYLDEAIIRSKLDKNPDAQTIARRERQKKDRQQAKLARMPVAVRQKKLDAKEEILRHWDDIRDAASEDEEGEEGICA